jgi:hydrogenase nickel incorporation protein HypA/HybF
LPKFINPSDAIGEGTSSPTSGSNCGTIGPLSGIVPELLAQAFTIASADTVAHSAELILETLPVRVRCLSCGGETEVDANRLICAHCGDWQTQLISGDEMLLTKIEFILMAH